MSGEGDHSEGDDLERRLINHVLGSEALLRVMSAVEEMAIPNWYLVAGALAQSVWNAALGHPLLARVKDVDVVYFDSDDPTEMMDNIFSERLRRSLK